MKNKEKIGFQSHHFGLKKDVTLILPNFFTLGRHEFGEKEFESDEDRFVPSRGTRI